MKNLLFLLLFVSVSGYAQIENEVIWERNFGTNRYDAANSMQATTDGGYILAGCTHSIVTGIDIWVVKTDAQGNEVWSKSFGTENQDVAEVVKQTSDGGYILGCYIGYDQETSDSWDLYIIKLDANGNEEWTKTYDGESYFGANSIIELSFGGYMVGAFDYSEGNKNYSDACFIRLDENGEEIWKFVTGQLGFDIIWEAKETSDGVVFAGVTSSTEMNPRDVMLVKRDFDGNEVWIKRFDFGNTEDRGFSLDIAPDNGFVITGFKVDEYTGLKNAILIKTDEEGNIEWNKEYAYENQSFEYVRSVINAKNGGYIITGSLRLSTNNYNAIILKTDAEGNEEWYSLYSQGVYSEIGENIHQVNDNEFVIGGLIAKTSFDSDMFLTRIKVNTTTDISNLSTQAASFSCYPNPFQYDIRIEFETIANIQSLQIVDITGRLIRTLKLNSLTENVLIWDGTNNQNMKVPAGIYFCRADNQTIKIIKK